MLRAALGVASAVTLAVFDVSPKPKQPISARCIDPDTDIRRRVHGGADAEIFWVETVDFDGDGRPDLMGADEGWCGSGGCNPWFLYVRRTACARFVGVAVGQDPVVVKRQKSGWADVRIESHGGYCPYAETELRFDGRAYREVGSRWCDCVHDVGDRRDMTVIPEPDSNLRCTHWRR